jgi:hypothetical protein
MTRWDDNYIGDRMDEAFIIVSISDVTNVLLSKCIQTSANTLRKNNDQTKAVLKFKCTYNESEDDTAFSSYRKYSYDEIKSIMATSDWTTSDIA